MLRHFPLGSAFTGVPAAPSVATFLDHWLAHVAWPRLRFSTARTYASVVGHIIVPVLGETPVRALRSSDLEKAQLVWQRAGVTVWMRRKAVEVLRSALNHAVALAPKRPQAQAWLDLRAARQLLDDVMGHPLEAAYALAIGLGLRGGEIAGLTWADVDLRERRIFVRWNRVELEQGTRLMAPKTAASRRALAMPARCTACSERKRPASGRRPRRRGPR